jgi:hypothetical protein
VYDGCASATTLFDQPRKLLQLGGTTIVLHYHAIPNIQLLLESDPCWWNYDALKCVYLDVVMFREAHRPKWLIGCGGTVVRNSVNRTSDSTVNNALFGAETIATGEQKRQDQCALYLLVFKNTRDNPRVRKRKCPFTPCVPARLDRH